MGSIKPEYGTTVTISAQEFHDIVREGLEKALGGKKVGVVQAVQILDRGTVRITCSQGGLSDYVYEAPPKN